MTRLRDVVVVAGLLGSLCPLAAGAQPVTPVPPVTDADRAVAFPKVQPYAMQDRAFHTYVLLDELEWQRGDAGQGPSWDAGAWFGGDRNRLWLRTEGSAEGGRLQGGEAHVLYGRAIARWWDGVAGLRQDVRPGPDQSWMAVGVQGLAPYWFDIEATAYLGDGGQTAARLQAAYELLLTNRLILQPVVEANLFGKTDLERGVAGGSGTVDTEFRLRYEFRREFAPYIGVGWYRRFGDTLRVADETSDEASRGRRWLAGLRVWF